MQALNWDWPSLFGRRRTGGTNWMERPILRPEGANAAVCRGETMICVPAKYLTEATSETGLYTPTAAAGG